jgi:hypothetical protein
LVLVPYSIPHWFCAFVKVNSGHQLLFINKEQHYSVAETIDDITKHGIDAPNTLPLIFSVFLYSFALLSPVSLFPQKLLPR